MELMKKYIAVLRDVENPVKDKTADVKTKGGGKYQYGYADLAQVLGIVKDACLAHDMMVFQSTYIEDSNTYLCTTISDGDESKDLALTKMPEMSDVQALGSWITYMRRYQLLIAFGLAPEDDDGQGARKVPTANNAQDPLERAQYNLVAAEKKYCAANGIDNWGDFHREVIMKRPDYANDVATLDMIAAELVAAS